MTKQIHFVVHITQHMLIIEIVRTTLLENWDHPVFLLKSGINSTTK